MVSVTFHKSFPKSALRGIGFTNISGKAGSSSFSPPPVSSPISGPQPNLINLVEQTASDFSSNFGWSLGNGLSIGGGVLTADGSSGTQSTAQYTLPQPVTIGNTYMVSAHLTALSSGNVNLAFAGAGFQNSPSASAAARIVNRLFLVNAAYPLGRMIFPAGTVATVDKFEIYDITPLLQKPWDIYILAGQSNIVGGSAGAPNFIRDTPEFRALYIPSTQNNPWGTTLVGGLGSPISPQEPLQHASGGNSGVGPGTSFSKTMCDNTANERVVVLIAAGYSGASLLQANGEWNRTGSNPAAINNLVAQTNHALTIGPSGSRIAGMVWAHGESDSSNAASYNGKFSTDIVAYLRGIYGQFPIVVGGLVPTSTYSALNTQLARLDRNSGTPDAISRLAYVPFSGTFNGVAAEAPNFVHFNADENVQRGTAFANAIRTL